MGAIAASQRRWVYQVAQAAVSCGVRRLVLASSLHAVSAMSDQTQVRAGAPPRPGNLYGATKSLGRGVRCVGCGHDADVCGRLADRLLLLSASGSWHRATRGVPAWRGRRDAAELVRAAVEAGGLTFVMANGISANRYRRADLEETMQRLDYRPVDDSWQSPHSTLNRPDARQLCTARH